LRHRLVPGCGHDAALVVGSVAGNIDHLPGRPDAALAKRIIKEAGSEGFLLFFFWTSFLAKIECALGAEMQAAPTAANPTEFPATNRMGGKHGRPGA
jgi:hypothetical protein